MIARIKLWAIHFLDFTVDAKLLRHRFPAVCLRISESDWWGNERCDCARCEHARSELFLL